MSINASVSTARKRGWPIQFLGSDGRWHPVGPEKPKPSVRYRIDPSFTMYRGDPIRNKGRRR